jgi:putative oxidoreductase
MNGTRDLAALVARVLIAVIFIISGYGKIGGFDETIQALAAKGLPLPQVAAAIAIVVELGGGVLLAIGWKTRWVAGVGLILFTIAASFLFHDFWNLADAARRADEINFMKNVAIIGGLLMVVAFGPGRYSVDRRLPARGAIDERLTIREGASQARSSPAHR